MKRSLIVLFVLLITSLLIASILAAKEEGRTETSTGKATSVDYMNSFVSLFKYRIVTGKVTSVDSSSKAITISAKTDSEMMDVGTIVNADTKVTVKGKHASLNDIKEGDTITIRYLKSDDLYAKEIRKK